MSKKYKLFSDVTSVSNTARIRLKADHLMTPEGKVVSWVKLAPRLRDRDVTETQAKTLILAEISQPEPREDIVRRLVSYLSYSGKEQTMEAINKILFND